MHFVEKDPSQKRLDFDQKLKSNKILRVPGAYNCLLYTSPSPRDVEESRMPSSA